MDITSIPLSPPIFNAFKDDFKILSTLYKSATKKNLNFIIAGSFCTELMQYQLSTIDSTITPLSSNDIDIWIDNDSVNYFSNVLETNGYQAIRTTDNATTFYKSEVVTSVKESGGFVLFGEGLKPKEHDDTAKNIQLCYNKSGIDFSMDKETVSQAVISQFDFTINQVYLDVSTKNLNASSKTIEDIYNRVLDVHNVSNASFRRIMKYIDRGFIPTTSVMLLIPGLLEDKEDKGLY